MQQKSLRIATIVATLLAGVALQGCGTTPGVRQQSGPPPLPSYPPTNCDDTGGNCNITVHVDDCHGEKGIRVEPTYALTHSGAVMIWSIRTNGYSFASNGIDFGSNPGLQPLPNQPNPPWQFRVRNSAPAGFGSYYYVNVVGCRQGDPWIKNN